MYVELYYYVARRGRVEGGARSCQTESFCRIWPKTHAPAESVAALGFSSADAPDDDLRVCLCWTGGKWVGIVLAGSISLRSLLHVWRTRCAPVGRRMRKRRGSAGALSVQSTSPATRRARPFEGFRVQHARNKLIAVR